MENRAEVPSTFEMRTMLTLAERVWSLGLLDVITAFLYAALNEKEDGIIIVQPPTILVRLGLVKPGVMWKLKKALYGLRCAPKRWGEERDATLNGQTVEVDGEQATMQQCETAKGVWKLKCGDEAKGRCMVYVDDVLVSAPTKWVEGVMNAFKSIWDCKLMGHHREIW